MFGTLKKIFTAVVLVVALVLAAYAGFRWGHFTTNNSLTYHCH